MVSRTSIATCVAVLAAVLLSVAVFAQPIADARLEGEASKVLKTGNRYPDVKLEMDKSLSDTIKRLRKESIDRRARLTASKETALDSNPPAGFDPNTAAAASAEEAQGLFSKLLAGALEAWNAMGAAAPAASTPSATLLIQAPFDDWGMATMTDRGALAAAAADPLTGSLLSISASSSAGMHLLAEGLVWVEKAFIAPATGNMTVRVADGGSAFSDDAAIGFVDDGTQPWQNYQATRLKANWLSACHPASGTWREQVSPAGRGKPMLPPIRVNQGDVVLVAVGVDTYVCTRYGAVATAICSATSAPISVEIR